MYDRGPKSSYERGLLQRGCIFYVDDSVIYIKSELQPEEFKYRIGVLNQYLEEWCDTSKSPKRYNLNEFISEDYLKFQARIEYKIAFHKEKRALLPLLTR